MATPFWQQPKKIPKQDTLGKDLDPTAQARPPAPKPMGTTGQQPKPPAFGGDTGGPGAMQPARQPAQPPQQLGQQQKPVPLTPAQQSAVNAARGAQTPSPAPQTYTYQVAKDLKPAQPTGDAALQQAINSLLNADVRDTAAEQQRAREIAAEREGQAVASQRARAGFGGFGLSGAASAQESDIRRAAAGQLSSDLLGIDAQARGEQQAKQLAGVQAGLASAQNDIQREAWGLALKQLEALYGEDYNGDGVVSGAEKVQADEAKVAQDTAKTSASALAGQELSASQKAQLKQDGVRLTAVKVGSPPFDSYEWHDQFGNIYSMNDADLEKYLYG